MLYGLWDLSSLTRNLTWVLAVKVPNHWAAREFPKEIFLMCHLIPLLICPVIFLVVGLVITASTLKFIKVNFQLISVNYDNFATIAHFLLFSLCYYCHIGYIYIFNKLYA